MVEQLQSMVDRLASADPQLITSPMIAIMIGAWIFNLSEISTLKRTVQSGELEIKDTTTEFLVGLFGVAMASTGVIWLGFNFFHTVL